jgi:hypothetical protein
MRAWISAMALGLLATSAGMFPLVTACMNWSFDIDIRLDKLEGVAAAAVPAADAAPVAVPEVVGAVGAAPDAVDGLLLPATLAVAGAAVAAVTANEDAVAVAGAAVAVAAVVEVLELAVVLAACVGTWVHPVEVGAPVRREVETLSVTVTVVPPILMETLTCSRRGELLSGTGTRGVSGVDAPSVGMAVAVAGAGCALGATVVPGAAVALVAVPGAGVAVGWAAVVAPPLASAVSSEITCGSDGTRVGGGVGSAPAVPTGVEAALAAAVVEPGSPCAICGRSLSASAIWLRA